VQEKGQLSNASSIKYDDKDVSVYQRFGNNEPKHTIVDNLKAFVSDGGYG